MQRYAQPQPAAQYRPAMPMPTTGMVSQPVAMAPQPTYAQPTYSQAANAVTRMPSSQAGQMVVQAGTMKSMPTTGATYPATTMTQIASQYSGFAASSATMQSTTQVANTYGTQQAANTYGTQQWMPGQTMPQTTALAVAPASSQAMQACTTQQPVSSVGASATRTARELELEKKLRELESMLDQKNREIKDLRSALQRGGGRGTQSTDTFRDNGRYGGSLKKSTSSPGASKRSGRPTNNRSPLMEGKPTHAYQALDLEDPVDTRLEEFYNSTNSVIPFRRINRGFYRFGSTICELKIINNKLMACTEDGWNRGHFAPVDKFMTYYEPLERDRAGIALD